MVDAGPFIHLDQIGHLRLLERLPALVIPPSVVQELTHSDLSAELRALNRWPNVTIRVVRRPLTQALATQIGRVRLHRGERDCLRLAVEQQPCVFLTDDLAARSVTERLRIEVHGTVGLIACGVKRRWLSVPMAEEALKALYHRSSLFITSAIIESAIQRVREPA